MVKMSFTTKQNAFDYALYMIASSYFDKAICKSKRLEGNLLLQYKEQKTDKQLQMEDLCISYMDKLVKKLPKEVFQQNMEVHLKRNREGVPTQVLFRGQDYILALYGVYSGKKPKFRCRIWAKKSPDGLNSNDIAA